MNFRLMSRPLAALSNKKRYFGLNGLDFAYRPFDRVVVIPDVK
jgi:hypothetical protein